MSEFERVMMGGILAATFVLLCMILGLMVAGVLTGELRFGCTP